MCKMRNYTLIPAQSENGQKLRTFDDEMGKAVGFVVSSTAESIYNLSQSDKLKI